MMLYLLFLVLFLGGNVNSQTANGTKEELSDVLRNQTSGEFVTSTTKPVNRTSGLFGDETRLIEEELGNNQTFIAEDDERFQDPDSELLGGKLCQQEALQEFSHSFCGQHFHTEMESVSPENWCELENIMRPYNGCMKCLEELSLLLYCFYPNPIVQDLFLSIHLDYFHNCSSSEEELLFVDAPHELVVVFTLVPVSIIPVLVYLVVWKSGVKE